MFRARSYMAFSVMPRAPVMDWLADIDVTLERSKGFFAGYPVALDLSAVQLSTNAIGQLIDNLGERGIRVLGIEGIASENYDSRLPPILRPGHGPTAAKLPDTDIAVAEPAPLPVKAPQPASLLIEDPVRSGQSIVFIDGDITVLGSVGSGAEVVAGGSIHVYGTLRGRAMAGATATTARVSSGFTVIEAELLAIDARFKTADDIDDSLRRGPAQAWLEGSTLKISAMS